MTASTTLWQKGWCDLAQRLYSPNYNARPAGACVDLLVLHSISLPPGQYGGKYIEQFFANQLDCDTHPYFEQIRGLQVSAHFVIRRDGAIQQFVSCDDRAWHAGVSCWRGRSNCNDDSIGVELEGIDGNVFTHEQYQSLVRLAHEIAARYPLAHVAGHEHIAPGRKTDPGSGFDWEYFQRLTAWPASWFAHRVS